jgi:hypothetical protein
MAGFYFPVNQKFVNMRPKPGDLVSFKPRSSWDGWFAIAIFPYGQELLWLKAHMFMRSCGEKMHPLASFEGMDRHSELMIAYAGAEYLHMETRQIDAEPLSSSKDPFKVELADIFNFQGTEGKYNMYFKMPGTGINARFDFISGWPLWWSKWGSLLHYVGQHCEVRVLVQGKDINVGQKGFGVVEHVCGFSLPFDITKLMPVHYHWDVLAFHTPDAPFDSAAGLFLGYKTRIFIGLRSAAKFPGKSVTAMKGLHVEYLEVAEDDDGKGNKIGRPLRWQGKMESKEATFSYIAESSTPLAKIIPGGGMQGFIFEGELKPKTGTSKIFTGTGFSEYGDFAGNLIK